MVAGPVCGVCERLSESKQFWRADKAAVHLPTAFPTSCAAKGLPTVGVTIG